MKPIIAFTYSPFQSIFTRFMIKLAIILSGGKPLGLVSKKYDDIPHFDGLILGGGVDIYPKRYNGNPKINYRYDFERDNLEWQLLESAFSQKKPVLGICRGCQMLNVFRHGTLHEDIRKIDEYTRYPSHLWGYIFFRKTIDIVSESILFKCIRKKTVKVNSLHKQCINKLGEGFKVTAIEKNNIIQSIEDPNDTFIIGVQFHPEFLIYKRSFLRIFCYLVQKSKEMKNNRN